MTNSERKLTASEVELLAALNKGTAVINALTEELKEAYDLLKLQSEEIQRLRNQLPNYILKA